MNKQVLIVDDENLILTGMRRYFEASGYTVDCAREREEALALLAHKPYDCLIADLCLTPAHGPDGLEIVAQSRWLAPKTRVVVLTAAGTPAVEAEAFRLGAHAFLRKPQPLPLVAKTVEALVAAAPSDERYTPMATAEPTAGRQKTVLLVDDSKTALFMQTTILKQGPYRLITANDGEEAVRVAQREKPDLILMDVIMPKMTGVDACRELRSKADTRNIPIILVTTRGEDNNVQNGYEAGCDDYLTKPVSAPALLAKVRSYVGN